MAEVITRVSFGAAIGAIGHYRFLAQLMERGIHGSMREIEASVLVCDQQSHASSGEEAAGQPSNAVTDDVGGGEGGRTPDPLLANHLLDKQAVSASKTFR